MKKKISERIILVSEKIGAFAVMLGTARNKATANLIKTFMEEYQQERKFLTELLNEVDNYCKEQSDIKEHGTTNWQE